MNFLSRRIRSPEKQFWLEIELRLNNGNIGDDVLVLSPRQGRAFKLAGHKVESAMRLKNSLMALGKSIIPINIEMFEQHLEVWKSLHLISNLGLEDRYLDQLKMPAFMAPPDYPELIQRLGFLVKNRQLGTEFENLWWQFGKMCWAKDFIHFIEPFRSVQGSAVDGPHDLLLGRYIFALWLQKNQWVPGSRNKKFLGNKLAQHISGILDQRSEGLAKLWYYKHLTFMVSEFDAESDLFDQEEAAEVLKKAQARQSVFGTRLEKVGLETKSGEQADLFQHAKLTKTLRNFRDQEVSDYLADGFFSISDFLEIFPTPGGGNIE